MSLRAPVHKNGLERVSLILGARLGRKLFPIEGEESGIRVTAYLAAPDLAQTTSRCLFLFVGRRAIRDRGMLMAVARGYGELVPRGRYPVAVVRVDVSMTDVDVNVHPQKAEVRFSDAQAVYAAVRHTVARGVASAPWLGEIGGAAGLTFRDTAGQAVSPMSRELAGYQQRSLNFQRTVAPWARIGRPDGDLVYGGIERGGEAGLLGGGGAGLLGGGGAGLLGGGGAGLPPGGEAGLPPGGEAGLPGSGEAGLSAERVVWKGSAATSPEAVPDFFSSLRYIGQLDRTFLLCERAGELILVDQHAAHERVVYERLRARRRHEGPASQPLLFPEVLEVSAAEAAHVETFTDELHAAGFVLEPFGDSGQRSTVALKATPAGLRDEPRGVVLELLADLSDFQATDATASRFDLAMATVACHSSVRAGDVLSPAEVVALFADLDRIEYRANCPHGRPVLLRISLGEIARRFGRSA